MPFSVPFSLLRDRLGGNERQLQCIGGEGDKTDEREEAEAHSKMKQISLGRLSAHRAQYYNRFHPKVVFPTPPQAPRMQRATFKDFVCFVYGTSASK